MLRIDGELDSLPGPAGPGHSNPTAGSSAASGRLYTCNSIPVLPAPHAWNRCKSCLPTSLHRNRDAVRQCNHLGSLLRQWNVFREDCVRKQVSK